MQQVALPAIAMQSGVGSEALQQSAVCACTWMQSPPRAAHSMSMPGTGGTSAILLQAGEMPSATDASRSPPLLAAEELDAAEVVLIELPASEPGDCSTRPPQATANTTKVCVIVARIATAIVALAIRHAGFVSHQQIGVVAAS
jgi:hypothetical protein